MPNEQPPKISVLICTRDRPKDLACLLSTILNQNHNSMEVVIVDDSTMHSAKNIADYFSSEFKSISCELKYIEGSSDGLTAARNLGVKVCEGDVILFLDDDVLLDRNVVSALVTFLTKNPMALGVQPKMLFFTSDRSNEGLTKKLKNIISKSLMLAYYKTNKLEVRRSGTSVFPNDLTRIILVQRLFGCCCYRRKVFNESIFDTNLKRWGFMEDLDFSYRIFKKNPHSLYAFPHATIVHNMSRETRLSTKQSIYMTTIYWSYVFFKDVFEGSLLNLIAFLWALGGNLVVTVGWLIIRRRPKRQWWELVYLLNSYFCAFGHFREIKSENLEFFNKRLKVD